VTGEKKVGLGDGNGVYLSATGIGNIVRRKLHP